MPKMPGIPDEQADTIYNQLSNQAANNKKRMMPRGAFSYPMVGRAVNEVEKRQPDLRDIPINVDPWTDKYAGSSDVASTPPRFKGQEQEIRLNPALMAFPQGLTENALAHELQHVRQNRNIDPNNPEQLAKYASEFAMPYRMRPSEKEGFAAGDAYNKMRGLPDNWVADPEVLHAFPRFRQ
jgi:hypothetical protein